MRLSMIGLMAALSFQLQSDSVARKVQGSVFRSDDLPKIAIQVDQRLKYVGAKRFQLGDKAAVERHHFVESEGGQIDRMVILQLEGFLEGAAGRYRYRIPEALASGNHRFSPRPVRLGGHEYIHNTWAFAWDANVRSNPGAEADQSRRLLQAAGFEVPDGWVMSRFVRAVGESKRHEIILFYMEPLSRWGASIGGFPDGPPTPRFDRISTEITARSLESFQIIEG